MLTIFVGLLYILHYYRNDEPPSRDIISPCATLSICYMIVSSYENTTIANILCSALLIDAVADLFMHSKSLGECLMIFSLGHLIKQLVVLLITTSSEAHNGLTIIVILFFVTVLSVLKLASSVDSNRTSAIIGYYSIIIGITLLSVSIVKSKVDLGYLCYITSDLIIGYELAIKKIYPRYLRILVVPILYWLGQYLTVKHLLQ